MTGQHQKEPGSILFAPSVQVFIYIDEIPPEPSAPQAKQCQLSQPFLIREMLQSLCHPYGSSQESLRYVRVLYWGGQNWTQDPWDLPGLSRLALSEYLAEPNEWPTLEKPPSSPTVNYSWIFPSLHFSRTMIHPVSHRLCRTIWYVRQRIRKICHPYPAAWREVEVSEADSAILVLFIYWLVRVTLIFLSETLALLQVQILAQMLLLNKRAPKALARL